MIPLLRQFDLRHKAIDLQIVDIVIDSIHLLLVLQDNTFHRFLFRSGYLYAQSFEVSRTVDLAIHLTEILLILYHRSQALLMN